MGLGFWRCGNTWTWGWAQFHPAAVFLSLDSDDALLKMTISQQEFGRTGLPDLSSMTEEEQIAYAMQMSLQGAGEPGPGWAGCGRDTAERNGTEQTDLSSSEFGQAESADMDASSAMDTSEPTKVRASDDSMPPSALKSRVEILSLLGLEPFLSQGFIDELFLEQKERNPWR